MKTYHNHIWHRTASLALILSLILPGIPSAAQVNANPGPEDPITIILDGIRDTGYITVSRDPEGDLGAPGGLLETRWTDLTDLWVAADANNLYIFADLPAYTQTVSTGQVGIALDVDANPFNGGPEDPWQNAISFAYHSLDGTNAPAIWFPDYVIRGNIPGDQPGDNGWTELRNWNGTDWDGSGINWGGISGSGQVGTHIAYADNSGVELAIPLADLNNPDPADVHVEVFTTQGSSTKGAYDTLPTDSQSVGWDDPTTLENLASVPLAIDAADDLADPGPGGWQGTLWTDQTRLHIWADHASLHVFLPMPAYDPAISDGQIGLAIDTQPGGGTYDPWMNVITFTYTATWQNMGSIPVTVTPPVLPEFVIRGNIFGNGGNNGWTELRIWDGNDFDNGAGIDWGGIGNSGQPSLPGSNVAWSPQDGLRLTIPFVDLGIAGGSTVNLEFFATQGSTTKGVYDTLPSDDQSTGWDDPTIQRFLASYVIPEVRTPDPGHDGMIWWDYLGHNSRDLAYRTPDGPVPTGTPVLLRLRAASGDLTAARVRLYNDRTNSQSLLTMQLVADDGTYEWWQAEAPASDLPTVYWYRFLVIDGATTGYYADDNLRTGGWGEPTAMMVDNSYQLTIYDPAFTTPEWIKNAVVYQIFPDRFRDGDTSNNTLPGSFFYNEPDGTIFRSDPAGGAGNDWNTVICDPRDPDACPGMWSQNFYGGDLQGVIDRLDYLQNLGITAIYFNPIFESPSNHRYDTTDYSQIDDSLGSLALFESFVQEANNRGINIILDGVFNHTSSDSLYFDRYHRYPDTPAGACESPASPYRDWYFFTDVTPGDGPCAGSDGTPNAATYTSWFGFDSLPKLDSSNQAVRDLIWAGGSDSIAPYWVMTGRADGWRLDVGGDVDPGTLNDPNNDYWEGFRTALHAVNPEAYIAGEEWGYASSWTIGGEWDAVMNYQFSSAALGFWRDSAFIDNDHNAGSSAGIIEPLMPSQFDERLLNLQERYAPQAFLAMMNLLDSHDTNRALFMLDENTSQNDPSLYLDPAYDWSDALTRLRGVAILQMTLPGAPTIYYGDEVGLVGPVGYDLANNTWQDDPYNRQPYPWLDQSGTPFYTHLQSQTIQDALREFYTLLIDTRNAHPALRTGTFNTLLTDDPNLVYAFGRRSLNPVDAAVVVLNSHNVTHMASLDVSGYLPAGLQFVDALHNNTPYTVNPDGTLFIPDVPPMSAVLLVHSGGDIHPPAAPQYLAAGEGESQVQLTWNAVGGAASYNIYRSLLNGGGFSLVASSAQPAYLDTGLENGTLYYYYVTALAGEGLESTPSNQAAGMPHWQIDWAILLSPAEITHTIGLTPTLSIYGQAYIAGVTTLPGQTPSLFAQIGFGPASTPPADWTTWLDAPFNGDQGENDEFAQALVPEATGDFAYVYRYTTTAGRDWIYADLDGIFSGMPANPGIMHVLPSSDVTSPAAPQNLSLTNWSADFLELSWEAVPGDPSMFAYDVFRSEISSTVGTRLTRVLHPTTIFTDTQVTSGVTYYYVVQAVDSSFNRSPFSTQVSGTPEARQVLVTFTVSVPAFTPGTVYIVGDNDSLGNWNPGAVAMQQRGPSTWSITLTFLDGTPLQYKFTRGSWETVEKEADGNTEIPNRQLVVDYGGDGSQWVNLTVGNWRDPLVVSFSPADGATLVPTDTLITAVWSQAMQPGVSFSVSGPQGPVAGSFAYDDLSWSVTFTPASALFENGLYTVQVTGQVDAAGDLQQTPAAWSFWTGLPSYQIKLPVIFKQ